MVEILVTQKLLLSVADIPPQWFAGNDFLMLRSNRLLGLFGETGSILISTTNPKRVQQSVKRSWHFLLLGHPIETES